MFKVTFDVFGTYTHGKLAGKVNPKASVLMTFFGDDFKHCKGKLNSQTDGAFYKVYDVVNLTPELS